MVDLTCQYITEDNQCSFWGKPMAEVEKEVNGRSLCPCLEWSPRTFSHEDGKQEYWKFKPICPDCGKVMEDNGCVARSAMGNLEELPCWACPNGCETQILK